MKQNRFRRSFRLTLLPMGVVLKAEESRTIAEILADSDIALSADCGSQGTCGKCLVTAHPSAHLSAPTRMENRLIGSASVTPGLGNKRLACQARIQGDIYVLLPAWGEAKDPILPKEDLSGTFAADRLTRRVYLEGTRWHESSASDFYDWACREVESTVGRPVSIEAADVQRRLSDPVTRDTTNTLVVHDVRGITAVLRGERSRSAGLAVDIGTTSIAAYLCDLQTGEVLATAGMLNPQQPFGEDVMSRIAYATRESKGLRQLNSAVIEGVNALLDECLKKADIDRRDVDEITIAGNPTMQQIFSGFHPASLGTAPFTPFRRSEINLRAADIGCKLNASTNIYVFPVVSGFIGGDILGGVLLDRTFDRDETTLVMDIGTNGELVLGNRHGLWATSCATGPAFEGAHISCGMRAATGAIYSISIDPGDSQISYRAFGEQEGISVKGICGSGLIDAVAAMLRTGLILPSGAFNSKEGDRIDKHTRSGRRMVIVPAAHSDRDREISITAKDIRQVQLAKAALITGVELLKRRSGLMHIDRVVLTGAFGTTFNPDSAAIVGILPPKHDYGRLEIVPNAAGLGAVMALLSKTRRKELETLYPEIETLELATDPDFPSTFVEMIPFLKHAAAVPKGEKRYGS